MYWGLGFLVSETIIGVLIGGVLTGIGTWISMWLQHKKWKAEQRIKILELKRNRFETLSIQTLKSLSDGMKKGSYSSDMMSNIEIIFPKSVSKEFDDFMSKKNKTEQDLRFAFLDISLEIKKVIANIDKEIEKILYKSGGIMENWYKNITKGQKIFIYLVSTSVAVFGVGLLALAVLIYLELGQRAR
jgi:hypothetical protein